MAILPIISFVIYGFACFGATRNEALINAETGDISVMQYLLESSRVSHVYINKSASGGYTWSPSFPDGSSSILSVLDLMFTLNTGGINVNGNLVMGGLYLLQESGVLITTPMIFASYLFVYYFAICILSMLWDLITFVPRKCSEIFQ